LARITVDDRSRAARTYGVTVALHQLKGKETGERRRHLHAGPQSASLRAGMAAESPSEMWTDRLRSRKTILIVAADPVIRGLLRRALRPAYFILQAANAEDAVRLAAQHRRNIDLLLTEVKLPRLSGWELLELLALDYPKLNVIYITKSINPEIRAHTRRQTVILLEQPFPQACLQEAVRNVLEGPQSIRAGLQETAPSLILRMRRYLRRHLWVHRTT
jgi:CheY-like chemotaxis protein